jgi:ubiquinone/menaquinone biosynthesis C-methylase UbiE
VPADYTTLAPIYDLAGMQTFAQQMAPRLVDFAQRNGWMGRSITDLGTGTGAGLPWLARHHYALTAVDANPLMLEMARGVTTDEMHINWVEADIRETGLNSESADLILALDVLTDLDESKDLESVFKSAYTVLKPGKWLIFDLYTIEGLTQLGQAGDKLVYDGTEATVFSHPTYDYDRQILRTDYTIFQADGSSWVRDRATRTTRAYATPVVTALLRRSNLQVLHVVTTDLQRYEPGQAGVPRILIMAQKR